MPDALKLVAVAPDDGWAFVRSNGRLLLIRPPYRDGAWSVVSERILQEGVARHGFSVSALEFDEWKQVVDHLRQQMSASWQSRPPLPANEVLETLIQHASVRILEAQLDNLSQLLEQEGKRKAVRKAIGVFLASEKVKNSELYTRCVELLAKCEDDTTGDLLAADWEERFPNAVRKLGAEELRAYSRTIEQQHQILQVCA
ncbi:MAG: hypothetical protein HY235_14675 [Acidobacteria bacterium]|nr:hypothetical protein [Acidobacteriota bacterium]